MVSSLKSVKFAKRVKPNPKLSFSSSNSSASSKKLSNKQNGSKSGSSFSKNFPRTRFAKMPRKLKRRSKLSRPKRGNSAVPKFAKPTFGSTTKPKSKFGSSSKPKPSFGSTLKLSNLSKPSFVKNSKPRSQKLLKLVVSKPQVVSKFGPISTPGILSEDENKVISKPKPKPITTGPPMSSKEDPHFVSRFFQSSRNFRFLFS